MTEKRREVAGFLTRVESRGSLKKSSARTEKRIPVDEIRRMGPKAVVKMNPDAKHFNIPPSGDEKPSLYVLGEVPGLEEDERGEHFVGKAARRLKSLIPRSLAVRYNTIVGTRTPKQRPPLAYEVEAFRRQVEDDIARTKPRVIMAVGIGPVLWALPHLPSTANDAKILRGRRFPVEIGGHRCWLFPVLHPAMILRLESAERAREDNIPGKQWVRFFDEDVKQAVAAASGRRLKAPVIVDHDIESLRKRVKLFAPGPGAEKSLLAALKGFRAGRPVTLDFETKGRPYGLDAKVLSIGLSDGRESLSFALDHPRGKWSAKVRSRILAAFRGVLERADRIVAQNAPFEVEWTCALFGEEGARLAPWEDTMAQAYILDHRKGALGLDFLAQYRLGVPVKSLSPINVKHLEVEALDDVLFYNALDAHFEHLLWLAQAEELKAAKLEEAYTIQCRRIPTVGLAQFRGLNIDIERVRIQQKDVGLELKAAVNGLARSPEGMKFRQRYGSEFKPFSSKDCVAMFRDVLKRPEGLKKVKKAGKIVETYSAAEEVLSAMTDCSFAQDLLRVRGLNKLKSTYLDRFLPDNPDTYLWEDGKVHCSFKTTATATGRLASEGPNNQNWPKRDAEAKKIRSIVVPSKGNLLLSSDYGQIEARVLGMTSKDKAFCDALWSEYDIHKHWAEKIHQRSPKSMKLSRCKDIGSFRSHVKNSFVFPLFYGAMVDRVESDCHLPRAIAEELVAEFWEEFQGVRAWQEATSRFYRKNGYVTTLTGRRRLGPLSQNMVINTPIQGTASDLTVLAMDLLSEAAFELDMPWLQPILNIHDDLVFDIPKKVFEEAVGIVAETMTGIVSYYDWINVPIKVEMEYGSDWYSMDKIGVFSSED